LGRDARSAGGSLLSHLWGPEIPERMQVRERGIAMEVDLHFGHKTGAFLDQRENLAAVRALAKGRGRALNLFSYTGGFSIAAALDDAALARSDLRAMSMLGQPADHPWLPAWPEGRYLKFAVLL